MILYLISRYSSVYVNVLRNKYTIRISSHRICLTGQGRLSTGSTLRRKLLNVFYIRVYTIRMMPTGAIKQVVVVRTQLEYLCNSEYFNLFGIFICFRFDYFVS